MVLHQRQVRVITIRNPKLFEQVCGRHSHKTPFHGATAHGFVALEPRSTDCVLLSFPQEQGFGFGAKARSQHSPWSCVSIHTVGIYKAHTTDQALGEACGTLQGKAQGPAPVDCMLCCATREELTT